MKPLFFSLLLCALQFITGCTGQSQSQAQAQSDTILPKTNGQTKTEEQQNAPKGKLIYCSYASVGHAAIGTNYCELIADPGTTPKIVVVKNEDCHFADPVKQEFEVDESVVAKAERGLAELKAWKINGYNKIDDMDGGRSCRIHIEYDSDETIHASWFTHQPKPMATNVYNYLESFFQPWYNKVNDTDDVVVEEEPAMP